MMKTIKYIVMGMVILSITMGGFTNIFGQAANGFVETYKSKEITSLLDKGDVFFTLVNRDQIDPEGARLGTCSETDAEEVWKHIHEKEFQNRLPKDLRFAWGWKSEAGSKTLYALRISQQPAPGLKDIHSVILQESSIDGSYDLLITFSKEGHESWARMTRENIGRNIAIVLQGKVATAPKVQMEIRQGKCQITGDFSKSEAIEIKTLLEN
jgi:SecD/SecF fusion protein